jgi:hypothetical protein
LTGRTGVEILDSASDHAVEVDDRRESNEYPFEVHWNVMTFRGYPKSLALLLILAISAPSFGESESDAGQRQQYDDAAKACGNSKDSGMAAAGIWGVMAALCGYNCYNYFSLKVEREAARAATLGYQTAIGFANTCTSGGAAAATGQVVKVQSTLGLADAEALKAAGSQAAPVSSAATGSSTPGHEMLVAELNAMVATATGLSGTCKGLAATYCAALAAPLCAACASCTPMMTASAMKLEAAALALEAKMIPIITTGKVCQYGSFAAAAGDVALAATVGKDATKGLIGIAGAAPGLMALLMSNQADTIGTTTAAMGKSSCWTAGLGLVLAGVHALQANKSASCQDENEKLAKQLHEPNPVLGLGKTEVSAVSSGVGSPAIVAGATSNAAAGATAINGSSSIFDVSSVVQNASRADKAIARIVSKSPEIFNEAIQRAASVFGVPSSELLRPGNLNNNKLSSMISAPDPETKGQVSALLASIDGQIGKGASQLALNSPAADAPKSSVYSTGSGGGTGAGGGHAFDLGTDAPGGVSGVATGASGKMPGVNPNDEFHAGFPGTIFQIVSMRIDKSVERVEKVEWQIPVNRFQHGLSLQPDAKRKR